MTVSNISCIGDLFEKGFLDKFFRFTFLVKHTEIFKYFCKNRLNLIQYLYNNSTDISTKDFIYTSQNKLEVSSNFIGKIASSEIRLECNDYIQQILHFNLRSILYKHYSFSIKKNRSFYKDFIKPIIEFYFKQDKSYFLQNKTKLFLDDYLDKQLKNSTEREFKRNRRILKNKEFSDEEVRYLVINDIFESLFLIDTKLVKQLKTTKNVVNYVCKKVLGETFDENKQVEKLLKPKVSRTNIDIDTSNTAIYGLYKSYVRDLDIVKEKFGVNDFISLDSDNRKLYLNNLEIDDIYLEDYISAIGIDEFSKPSKVIAYNILEYKYPELNRDDIRQRCSRAERNSVPVKPVLNKLEKLDLKLLETNNAIYNNRQELESTKSLKKLFSA